MTDKWALSVTDIECDGLYRESTLVHCATVRCLLTGAYEAYRPHEIGAYLDHLKEAKVYINHNIIGFDFPVLEKLYGFPWEVEECFDTLVVSRVYYPDRKPDHRLSTLGKMIGVYKGDYTGGWEEFSDEMLKYNIQDTEVAAALAKHFLSKMNIKPEELLEMREWLKA